MTQHQSLGRTEQRLHLSGLIVFKYPPFVHQMSCVLYLFTRDANKRVRA